MKALIAAQLPQHFFSKGPEVDDEMDFLFLAPLYVLRARARPEKIWGDLRPLVTRASPPPVKRKIRGVRGVGGGGVAPDRSVY